MPIPPVVSRNQRIYAACVAVVGIVSMWLNPTYAHGLSMGGMLLLAWREAFLPSPSARLRMREIHGEYTSVRFATTGIVRLVTVAGTLLIFASLYMTYAGGG